MFTGFPTTNTPSVQVWDFSRATSNGTGIKRVSLTEDCAPIQFFKGGFGSFGTGTVEIYLPSVAVNGKQITIINQTYSSGLTATALSLNIFAPDTSGGQTEIYRIQCANVVKLIFIQNELSAPAGFAQTSWHFIDLGSPSASNYFAYSVGYNNKSINPYSTTIGGSGLVASANNAAVLGGLTNTASGTNAFVAGGSSNTASGSGSTIIGGSTNTATTTNCLVVGGDSNNAQAISAGVFAGSNNTANGAYSCVIGGAFGTTRGIIGNLVYTACNDPLSLFTAGRAQNAVLTLVRQTTTATATVLTSNANAAGATNQVVLPTNSAYYVRGSCIANVTGGGNTKAWSFEAAIKQGASAATTAIVGAVIKNVVAADAGASTWDITISADTTNGALSVSVTGQASTTIRWVCKVESTEVSY